MRVNLVPLAGRGLRFVEAGYTVPKPLIPVNGVPMVVAAAKYLPKADSYTFIALKDHIDTYKIDRTLKKYFPPATVLTIDEVTRGQASTCMLAKDSISSHSILTIGACDNGMIYDESSFEKLIKQDDTDVVIWTFRHNPHVLNNPNHWGWVKIDNNGFVEKVSVKIPISKDPYNDYAVIGCFSFKKASYFFDNAEKMIVSNRQINNEYYIDECMNVILENGLKVKVFEVDKYIGWGTPNDLKTYQYWQRYFSK